MPALKSSTPSGRRQKTYNRYAAFRLYIIMGSLFLLVFFGVYTQVLIQNAKRDAQFVPRLFAQYIAYTDSYLTEAEKNTELLTEVLVRYLKFAGEPDYQERMWSYLNTEFITKLDIPIIITDGNKMPVSWFHVDVPSGIPLKT